MFIFEPLGREVFSKIRLKKIGGRVKKVLKSSPHFAKGFGYDLMHIIS